MAWVAARLHAACTCKLCEGQGGAAAAVPAQTDAAAPTGTACTQIKRDHMPGLFWIHPHRHGTSAMQTPTASALVVVEDNPAFLPDSRQVALAAADMPAPPKEAWSPRFHVCVSLPVSVSAVAPTTCLPAHPLTPRSGCKEVRELLASAPDVILHFALMPLMAPTRGTRVQGELLRCCCPAACGCAVFCLRLDLASFRTGDACGGV